MTPKTITASIALTLAAAGGVYTSLDESGASYVLTSVDGGSACAVPDCRTWGGWDERHAPVDCLSVGPLGEPDGGPRWRGCVSTDARYLVGSACLPAVCSVPAGVDPLAPVR